jgi:hypothetical protein
MASIIKADNLQKVSDDSNIIKKCGSTITVGSCGATVALASGASQTGFGTPSSSVLWCTTAKTSPFTAADKVGYFVNTSGGVVTVTLPSSPTAGDVVAIKDYLDTFDTNNVTIGRGGSKIGGNCIDATLDTKGDSIKLVYVDATRGWLNVQTDDTIQGSNFITATGGTESTSPCGNFKIHTFNADGPFNVTNIGGPTVGKQVSYMVIAGGGGGASEKASTTSRAGGGAGGFREAKQACAGYTASPLAVAGGQTVAVQSYPVIVGGGGAGGPGPGGPVNGSTGINSIFNGITSSGGGYGSGTSASACKGGDGGSGGGGTQDNAGGPTGGAGIGNSPPVSPPQGNSGGQSDRTGPTYLAGGGGGAGGAGGDAPPGNGGNGIATSITGSPVTRAGGGGGGASRGGTTRPAGAAGPGGGGQGNTGCGSLPASIGTVNTGSGGGGGAGGPNPSPSCGGAGGSGVVIIRYKFQ